MNKQYFLFSSDCNNYKQLILPTFEERDYISSIIGRPCNNPKVLNADWITETDDNHKLSVPDIAFINTYIPVCNEKVFKLLQASNYMLGNEFIPINIESYKWYIINICTQYEGILNLHKSKLSRYDDGRIMWISKFVFKKEILDESLFYLKEQPVSYFCTESFMNLLNANNIKGLIYTECKIKKSFF